MFDDADYQRLIEEAEQTTHQGVLADHTVTAAMTNASCGDEVEVFIKVSADGERIDNLSWQGQGCIISRAATSAITQHVLDKKISDVTTMSVATVLALLELEQISPGRLKCVTLGLEALKKALLKGLR